MYLREKVIWMVQHCRINLQNETFEPQLDYKLLDNPDGNKLLEIYDEYSKYKQFESPFPFYKEQFSHVDFDIIGYYDKDELVAWTMLYIINKDVVDCQQFAWNYRNPRLRIGFKSIETESFIYKSRGFKYIILGEASEYKSTCKGYELI